MKEIKLTQGEVALMDDEDFESINAYKWCVLKSKKNNTYYAMRSTYPGGKRVIAYMHRVITGASDGVVVDHVNGNGLDNRRSNLRTCTRSQNSWNSVIPKNNSTGFKGVSYKKRDHVWVARIGSKVAGSKQIHLGSFSSPEEAYFAYCEAAKKYHGDFART